MKFSKAYQYDKTTKEYLFQTKVQEDPMNPGSWLFPPCTVLTQPLAKADKKAIVWDQSKSEWYYKDDHRGEYLYNVDDSRQRLRITAIDFVIPEGYTIMVPPDETNWYKYKNEEWTIYHQPATKDELYELTYNEKCNVAYGHINIIKDDVTYTFAIDRQSMATIGNQLVAFSTLGQTSTIWKVYEDGVPTTITLTKEQFTNVYKAGKKVVNEAFVLQGTLNDQISNFTDKKLADYDYITEFKESVKSQFAAININFNI